jgi:hypothetical protein
LSKDEDRKQMSLARDRNTTRCENDARHIDGIRIAAQLIDATTGAHIWAERHDQDPTDIFAVQDEIAECVAAAIEQVASKRSGSRFARPDLLYLTLGM